MSRRGREDGPGRKAHPRDWGYSVHGKTFGREAAAAPLQGYRFLPVDPFVLDEMRPTLRNVYLFLNARFGYFASAAPFQVLLINRGKTPNPFSGDQRVRVVQCDRLNSRGRFREIVADAARDGLLFAIVDFVCFSAKGIGDVVDGIMASSPALVSLLSPLLHIHAHCTAETLT